MGRERERERETNDCPKPLEWGIFQLDWAIHSQHVTLNFLNSNSPRTPHFFLSFQMLKYCFQTVILSKYVHTFTKNVTICLFELIITANMNIQFAVNGVLINHMTFKIYVNNFLFLFNTWRNVSFRGACSSNPANHNPKVNIYKCSLPHFSFIYSYFICII